MKVETFLQHCISREKFTPEEESDARKFFVDRGVRYIRDWYSQPFKPELITELFEGWEINHRTHQNTLQVQTEKYFINFYISSKKESMMEMFFSTKSNFTVLVSPKNYIDRMIEHENYRVMTPSTLDEFISDSLRNGIELKWKEIEVQDETR